MPDAGITSVSEADHRTAMRVEAEECGRSSVIRALMSTTSDTPSLFSQRFAAAIGTGRASASRGGRAASMEASQSGAR